MSVLETLIAADRIVLAGLGAYDKAMANGWASAAEAMANDGIAAEEIQAAKEAHDERTLAARGKLHRELWGKALALIASSLPAEPVAGLATQTASGSTEGAGQ